MGDISDTLLAQRWRNRIIESLEVFASLEQQMLIGADETINMWEDCINEERLKIFIPPAVTSEEREAILKFHEVWEEVADSAPQFMPPVEELLPTAAWQKLMATAEEALLIFYKRGRLNEDIEVT